MNKKTWIIFAVAIVVVLGVLIAVSRGQRADVSDIDPSKIQSASEESGNIADHTFGKTDSSVTLIEYGDFQCPYCGQAHPNVKSVTEDYKDKIVFVFRNYPITSAHPNAKAAAAAAEAAGLQDKYWEMNNYLYENQSEWSTATASQRTDVFTNYARTIGVKDIEKFKKDMTETNVNKKISFDMSLAKKVGVTGTPAFFIDGKKVSDDVSSNIISGDGSKLRSALDTALKQ